MQRKTGHIPPCSRQFIAKLLPLFFILILSIEIPIASTEGSDPFSIVWISDTQYLSESNPQAFDAVCDWIVSNVPVLDVKMVVHSGDIVNLWNYTSQWENANSSMSKILDGGVPYGWCAGNHDQEDYGNQNGTWIGDNYAAFNTSIMKSKSYWVGDLFEGKNTAQLFNFNNLQFLVVHIENKANTTVLEWTKKLIQENPNSHVLIVTHSIFNYYGNYTDWAIDFKNQVVAQYPNIFMVMSGHEQGSITRHEKYSTHSVYELMFNKQNDENGGSYVRLLTIDADNGMILVKTYSPYLDDWLTDGDNEFSLNFSFSVSNRKVVIEELLIIAFTIVSIFVVTSYLFIRSYKKAHD